MFASLGYSKDKKKYLSFGHCLLFLCKDFLSLFKKYDHLPISHLRVGEQENKT